MNSTRLLVTGFTKTKVSSVSVSLFPGLLGGGSFRPTFGIWIHRIKWRQYNFCLIKVSVWKAFYNSVLVEWICSFRGVTTYQGLSSQHYETHISFFPHCMWLPYISSQPHISSISTKESMEISEGFSTIYLYLPHLLSSSRFYQLSVKFYWAGASISVENFIVYVSQCIHELKSLRSQKH